QNRVGARAGAAPVAAGLEVQVERGPACSSPGGMERDDLPMALSGIGVETLGDRAPVLHENRAHHRIGARLSFAETGQLQCPVHPTLPNRIGDSHGWLTRTVH